MRRLIEKANVVFKEMDCGERFEVLKTRDGQLTLGGKYSRDLVEFYAKTNDDVVVLGYGEELPEEAEPLKVGDYVKIIDDLTINGTVRAGVGVGEIRIIKEIGGDRFPYVAWKLDGTEWDCFRAEAVVKVTDEEVAEVKRKQAEFKRWAAIGRKPNEFKKGDAVKYKNAFTTVTESKPGLLRINQSNNVDKNIAVRPADLTLVFPVESRFE